MVELEIWLEENWFWWAGGLLVLVLLAVVPELIRRFRRDAEQRRIAQIFKERGAPFVKDVAFPDGMDGYVFVDYLVLTPDGILVMDLQDYNGFIFGAPNIDHWTQMVRRRGYKFENPLHQNAWRVQVIKTITKDAPAFGRVLFSAASQFPKGMPEGVSHMTTLAADLAPLFQNKSTPDSLKTVWDALVVTGVDARSQQWQKTRES
jgi:hypothetical protein